jgi:sirohydrochlorin cobaltochelatase
LPPTLPEAATELAAAGVRAIRVFPLFFGVGKHAREDLPLLVGQVQASHPGIAVELLAHRRRVPRTDALMANIALSLKPASHAALAQNRHNEVNN